MLLDSVKKKFLYIGLALIVVGIAVGFLSPGLALPSAFPPPISHNMTLASGAVDYLPMNLNESGLTILTFNSTAPLDFYLANATAFSSIESAASSNSSPRTAALSLEGSGVYEVYQNSRSGVFPYTNLPNVTAPAYLTNVTLMQQGTYYAVFYNSGNSSAAVNLATLALALSKIQSGEASIGLYLGVAVVLFIAGLAIAIYGFVSKEKQDGQQGGMDADAAREYDRIEKKGRRGKRAES